MITFKQFLSESDSRTVKQMIEEDCADFLKESHRRGFLYRGIKGLSSSTGGEVEGMEYAIKTPRSDRKPLDTAQNRHESIDKAMKPRFGWKPRSEGVFAFGDDVDVADLKAYGQPCIIFPVGPIKYVWSRHVEDLYNDMDIGDRVPADDDELDEIVEEWIMNSYYQDTELDVAVVRSHEIMIKCSKYYAFPIEYRDDLKKALGFS